MKERFELIKNLIDNFDSNKETIQTILKELDPFIKDNFPYPINEPVKNFFKFTPQENYEKLLKEKDLIKENPIIAIPSICKKAKEIMSDFIDKYCLGFVHDFYLNENGNFYIEINSMVSTSNYSNQTINQQKEKQKKILSDLGLSYEIDETGPIWLSSNDHNIKIIKDLLSTKGAKGFCYSVKYDKCLEFSFILPAENILNFLTEKDEEEILYKNGLKEVDINSVKKACEEIIFACASYNELNIKSTCSYLIHAYFSEICEITGIETNIKIEYDKRIKPDKLINWKITKLEEEIKQTVDFSNIKEIVAKLYKNLNNKLARNLSFRISEFKINSFGILTIKIKKVSKYDFLLREKVLPNEIFACAYDVIIDENSEMHILDTTDNKERFKSDISKFLQGFEITELDLSGYKNDYEIKSFTLKLQNFLNID